MQETLDYLVIENTDCKFVNSGMSQLAARSTAQDFTVLLRSNSNVFKISSIQNLNWKNGTG